MNNYRTNFANYIRFEVLTLIQFSYGFSRRVVLSVVTIVLPERRHNPQDLHRYICYTPGYHLCGIIVVTRDVILL
jgi:hypothetical protein